MSCPARPPIEEQRVVGFGWPLGDGLAGRMRQLIAGTDDEGLEREALIEG